jgi:CRP/FNR family transcriptional regulator, anaerobic regulatory protein
VDAGFQLISKEATAGEVNFAEGLSDCATAVRLAYQRRLTLSSELDDFVFVVMDGMASLEWASDDGPRRISQLFYPGDGFCTAFMPSLPNASIVTVHDMELLRFRRENLRKALLTHPERFSRYQHQLAHEQARQVMHACTIGGLTVDERVAALLIEFSLRLGEERSGRISFDLPLSRTDIADYLSLNADTLSRITSRLRSKGILSQVGRNKMYVDDWDALLSACPLSSAVVKLHSNRVTSPTFK